MAAHAEVGSVLDQRTFEGDLKGVIGQRAGFQRDERVTAEQAGAYRRPLRHSGGVVQIHLIHRADLVAVAVEGLTADQAARIDVGLHSPSNGSRLFVNTTKEQILDGGHSRSRRKVALV